MNKLFLVCAILVITSFTQGCSTAISGSKQTPTDANSDLVPPKLTSALIDQTSTPSATILPILSPSPSATETGSLILCVEGSVCEVVLRALSTKHPHNYPSPEISETPEPQTPVPSRTFQPPTMTMTPFPTKQIYMQYGLFGGDGGLASDYYLGRGMPKWVIYTDGQIIIKDTEYQSRDLLKEGFLDPQQMCYLRTLFINTGFFEIDTSNTPSEDNPIYEFDETMQFVDGAPAYIMQINGDLHNYVGVPLPYFDYLITEAKEAFEIPRNYQPENLVDYKPERLLLWIEEGYGFASETTEIEPWPEQLAPLHEFLHRKIAYPEMYQAFHVILENDEVQDIYNLFDNRLGYKLYKQDGKVYFLIARPLLPHESQNHFSPFPSYSDEIELPFICE